VAGDCLYLDSQRDRLDSWPTTPGPHGTHERYLYLPLSTSLLKVFFSKPVLLKKFQTNNKFWRKVTRCANAWAKLFHTYSRYRSTIPNTLRFANGCRYYLSILAQRDYYLAHHGAFDVNLIEYLSTNASPLVLFWRDSIYRYDFVLPFLRERFHSTTRIPRKSKPSKFDRALILLMSHPEWDDERIINELSTTAKQLAKWTMFQLARREQDRTLLES